MTEEIIKCVKGESCIHCGSTYCRFVDEVNELKQENKELKEFCIELEKQKEKQHNQWFERCTENHNEDSKIIDNYRSALEEIREIANDAYYNEEEYQATGVYKEIADKIDEVLR